METKEQMNERLHRVYVRGGPTTPYHCSCGKKYAVSDERRHCAAQHKPQEGKK
jgi:hypothetical protein